MLLPFLLASSQPNKHRLEHQWIVLGLHSALKVAFIGIKHSSEPENPIKMEETKKVLDSLKEILELLKKGEISAEDAKRLIKIFH